MMREYMQRLYDAVGFSMDSVRSRSEWRRWRRRTLRDLRRALGLERLPPRTPLRARVTGRLQRGEYVVEKVAFESRPGFLMAGNLYRPARLRGRAPAVLCVHGHTLKGKSSEAMQVRSANYARAGWVALAVDATGHGERVRIGHRRTFAMVTTGLTLEGVQVWDNMRAVDYLRSRPEVDARRIGITGCSGGGNQTMYTAAVDERIAAAVPVCSVSTLRGQIFTPNGIGCQCECVPDLMRYGLENAVVCGLIAPRPLLVLAGTKDRTFPVEHTRQAHRHLSRFYRALGWADRYRYVERPLPHGYPRALRQLAHGWFARWLAGRPATWRERPTEVEPPEAVWCFPGGRLPDGSATLGTLARQRADAQAGGRKLPRAGAARARLHRRLRDAVLGGVPKRVPLEPRAGRAVRRGGAVHQRVTLASEPGVTIAARLALPAQAGGRVPCVVRVRPRPGRRRWSQAGAFLARGVAVAELDVRTAGEDEHVNRAALVLGRPVVGMAAQDIARLVEYLVEREEIDGADVRLWAAGAMSLPALYALALEERIAGATLVGLLSTYVSDEPVRHPTWTFARGLLEIADVEHLVALAAPRPVLIANPVGADLKPLPRAMLGRAFAAARKAYGHSGGLRILSGGQGAVVRAALRA